MVSFASKREKQYKSESHSFIYMANQMHRKTFCVLNQTQWEKYSHCIFKDKQTSYSDWVIQNNNVINALWVYDGLMLLKFR